jgi:hypothetical protein
MKRLGFTYLLSIFLLGSCTRDKGKLAVPDTSCKTPETVSFSKDVMPVFNKYCGTSGCHSGASPAGNLNLDQSVAYNQLLHPSSGYVDTITPKYSLLYAQMNSVSQPMPPTGKLDPCTIDLVYKWIQQKAKNN